MRLNDFLFGAVLCVLVVASAFFTLEYYKPKNLKEIVFGYAGAAILVSTLLITGIMAYVGKFFGIDYRLFFRREV